LERFASAVSQLHLGDPQPVRADPWIISSLLQKSIRRGESEIAQRAALTLLSLRGSAIWARLMIIAFEDVGAGSPDALAMTVAVGSDPAFRSAIGGNPRTVAGIARVLCQSAKDRSADYLGCGPRFYPGLFAAPPADAFGSLKRQLCMVADLNAPLFLRRSPPGTPAASGGSARRTVGSPHSCKPTGPWGCRTFLSRRPPWPPRARASP
jgi:hypothetical protein